MRFFRFFWRRRKPRVRILIEGRPLNESVNYRIERRATDGHPNGLSYKQLLKIAEESGYFDGMPKMHQGGVVPGPKGSDVPFTAQKGEEITPLEDDEEGEAA